MDNETSITAPSDAISTPLTKSPLMRKPSSDDLNMSSSASGMLNPLMGVILPAMYAMMPAMVTPPTHPIIAINDFLEKPLSNIKDTHVVIATIMMAAGIAGNPLWINGINKNHIDRKSVV